MNNPTYTLDGVKKTAEDFEVYQEEIMKYFLPEPTTFDQAIKTYTESLQTQNSSSQRYAFTQCISTSKTFDQKMEVYRRTPNGDYFIEFKSYALTQCITACETFDQAVTVFYANDINGFKNSILEKIISFVQTKEQVHRVIYWTSRCPGPYKTLLDKIYELANTPAS